MSHRNILLTRNIRRDQNHTAPEYDDMICILFRSVPVVNLCTPQHINNTNYNEVTAREKHYRPFRINR